MISEMRCILSARKVRAFCQRSIFTANVFSKEEILDAIIKSNFVEILVENTRKGTMWGLEVASRLLQSDFLKIRKLFSNSSWPKTDPLGSIFSPIS